jgi:cytochrome c
MASETQREQGEMRTLVLVAAALAVSNGIAKAQDAAAGEAVFRVCRACHTIGPDAKNLVGPVLNGLDGRKSGTIEGYSYSDANKNSGITWNEASFKEYIVNPAAKIPNTKMAFVGIKNEKDIANLWAYLKQFKADGSK